MSEQTIIQGDCLEVMKTFADKSFDLVLTDPPYRDENQPTKDMRQNGGMKDFGKRLTQEQFEEIKRVSKNYIIWGANNFECVSPFKGFLVWEKGLPFDFTMSMAEIACLSEDLLTISKSFSFRIAGAEERYHPTQKPVELFKWCLEIAKDSLTILDPFMGSGTTLVAAKQLNRNAVGIEISPEYCQIARDRLSAQATPMF